VVPLSLIMFRFCKRCDKRMMVLLPRGILRHLLAFISVVLLLPSVAAKELLTGAVANDGSTPLAFTLSGESRQDIIGGEIILGDKTFAIQKVSRLGLIGATRVALNEGKQTFQFAEYAIFSSSFSNQTAVGKPWVASHAYKNCEQDYNSFLAVYRTHDEAQYQALGEVPYAKLSDDKQAVAESTCYCFISKPPD